MINANAPTPRGPLEKIVVIALLVFALLGIGSAVVSAIHGNFKEDLVQNLIIIIVGLGLLGLANYLQKRSAGN